MPLRLTLAVGVLTSNLNFLWPSVLALQAWRRQTDVRTDELHAQCVLLWPHNNVCYSCMSVIVNSHGCKLFVAREIRRQFTIIKQAFQLQTFI